MFEQLNFRVNYNNADYSDLYFPSGDRAILRTLSEQMAEIAARSIIDARRRLWVEHNSLRRTRPVLLCDPENG